MGFFDIFRRGDPADDALVALAGARGWPPVPASGMSMVPPSYAEADVHDLGRRGAPSCAGRTFVAARGIGGRDAAVSHLVMSLSDTEDAVCDMITWPIEPPCELRLEIGVGAGAWNHHRLGDRFGDGGSQTVRSAQGVVLRVARRVAPAASRALGEDARFAVLQACKDRVRGGFCVEVVGRRAAVFTMAVASHRGEDRWLALWEAAQAVDAMLADAARAAS
jgi:hypothetical protein